MKATYTAHTDAFHRAEFRTITAARKWAESLGSTANVCVIDKPDKRGNPQMVACHRRNPDGNGMHWYKANI